MIEAMNSLQKMLERYLLWPTELKHLIREKIRIQDCQEAIDEVFDVDRLNPCRSVTQHQEHRLPCQIREGLPYDGFSPNNYSRSYYRVINAAIADDLFTQLLGLSVIVSTLIGK